jgi:hypothetical protein
VVAATAWLATAHAQTTVASERANALVVAGHVPWGIQPGARLSLQLEVAGDDRESGTPSNSLRLGPQVAMYGAPSHHVTGLLGAEAVWRRVTGHRARYHDVGMGMSVVAESRVTGVTVALGSGDTETRRERSGHVLLDLRYRIGRQGSGRVGWFVGAMIGRRLSWEAPSSAFAAVEAGLSLPLTRGAR